MSEDQRALQPLLPEDIAALEGFRRGNAWLRAVLCTLARRGVEFRQAHPDRAAAILEALERSPLYKGGQFLFDLLEWEDFMLDGPLPDLLPTVLDGPALERLATLLDSIRRHLDGAGSDATLAMQFPALPAAASEAPPLESGFHLYRDVVIGALRSAAPLLAQVARLRTD